MATALYLYCLREPAGTPTPPAIQSVGVNAKGGVFIHAFDGIEAVVSEVDQDNYGEMQKKAQEDVRWIKEKALAHEMVVEEAMGKFHDVGAPLVGDRSACGGEDGRAQARPLHLIPVIPVKFGVIFNTEERLAEVLKRQHAAIAAAFRRIRAGQEWSVKIFLKDTQKFKGQISMETGKLCEKSKKIAELPAGLAYFMETEFNEELERECSRELDKEARSAFAQLKSKAVEAVIVKLLGKELTGRKERMVLNSAYLVLQSQLAQFRNAVAELSAQLMPKGFLVEQSGPWPAYHFTEFAHD